MRSAERLAQETADDLSAFYYRYRSVHLVVEGTLATLDRNNEFSQKASLANKSGVNIECALAPATTKAVAKMEVGQKVQLYVKVADEYKKNELHLTWCYPITGPGIWPEQPVRPQPRNLTDTELEEQIQKAGAGLKLVPLDMTIDGVEFTVQMPEGAKADSNKVRLGSKDIQFEPPDQLPPPQCRARPRRELRVRTVSGQTSDLLVHGALQSDRIEYTFARSLTLGHLDVHVDPLFGPLQPGRNPAASPLRSHGQVKDSYKPPQTIADLQKIGIGVIDDNPRTMRSAISAAAPSRTPPFPSSSS